ncbi:MAG TPA: peptide chain release factor 1 [Thermotogota bacterium]|nr:peptide chain release factor 1 [Thermotogota bacterium]HPJ89143.1 peptide chain release factor 1 [Thermotogota bacterium]HPR96751.1 peptide chain release factor 1 [Thermotogota bacterium]
MIEKKQIEVRLKRLNEINGLIAEPDVLSDMDRYQELLKERAYLEAFREKHEELTDLQGDISEYESYEDSEDEELKEMAAVELPGLREKLEKLDMELLTLLVPPDPADENNAIFEIRAGTGGDEAALFAGDLFKMYTRYADSRGWKVETIEETPTPIGGFKEIIFKIKGKGSFGAFKYEGGVHRVQRVPATEAGGRIHTSSASVVILPEITKNIEVQINPDDLRIDVYRASGAGGQHVNRTESAVRITHLPSGIVVTCQNQRSQHQNKDSAMGVLKSKLYERERQKEIGSQSSKRLSLIGTGDRSEKIRTYNYPQGRITDHRVGFTTYQLTYYMEGAIQDMLDFLKAEDIKDKLEESAKS